MTVKELKNILELVEDDSVPIQVEVLVEDIYHDVDVCGIRREPERVMILTDLFI